jgi:uncharacterized protein (DUF2267 family)
MQAIPQQSFPQLSQVTADWIDELDCHLGWNDKPRSYRLLTAVLLAMRAGAHPIRATNYNEFPVRLCGTRCDDLPVDAVEADDLHQFLGRVALGVKPDPLEDPEGAVVTVLELLAHRLGGLEFEALCRGLPFELRSGQARH